MALYKTCIVSSRIFADTLIFSRNVDSFNRCCLFRRKLTNKERFSGLKGIKDQKTNKTFAEIPPKPTSDSPPPTLKSLVQPFLFTVGFSTTTFVGCTIWQYENHRAKIQHFADNSNPMEWFTNIWLPKHRKMGDWRQKVNDYWNNLTEGQKIFAPVLFANVLVFLAWRIPRFQPTMLTFFASNPAAKIVCWPMLLSTFSHYGLFHLAANMYVLHSFSSGVVSALGKEQAAALYLSAGVIASFSSFLHKVVIRQSILSLGASGAIMAIIGFVCTAFPDTELSIILLPMFTFTAGSAIKVMVGIDAAGIIFGWKFFDHAAHLGGALTGIIWALWGNAYLWRHREPIFRMWHEFRTKPTE